MPKTAESIEVRGNEVLVDGEPFPWFIPQGPISAVVEDGVTVVTLRIFANRFTAQEPPP